MSINPLNDISKVYMEQVALPEAKVDKLKPEHERASARDARYDNPDGALELGGGVRRARRIAHRERDELNKDAKDIRRGKLGRPQFQGKTGAERIAIVKKAKGIYNSYEPEGEMVDEATPGRGGGSGAHPRKFMNTQGKPETKVVEPKKPISLAARKRAAGLPEEKNLNIGESEKPNDGNLANNYPPYDKVTRGDVIAGATGNDEMGGKKKKKDKKLREGFSNWRQDLSEVMTDTEYNEKITDKKIKNKIKTSAIGSGIKLGEAIEEIGGTLIEMIEIDEKMNLATADMGEVIKDFQTSDAPQFKGKTKEERRKMALAAKLEAERQANEELQPTTQQQFAAQRQLTMAQRKLTAADQAALRMKKKEVQQQEEFVSEEDYDRMKDKRMMRGGVDGNTNYRKPAKMGSSEPVNKERQKEVARKALELVRQQTISKYGKGSLM